VANLEKFADKVDLPNRPIYVLGSGADFHGPSYQHPPAWDLAGRRGDHVNGVVGRRAADRAFSHAGLRRDDVDVLELYDPFSFEIIRQLEAFGFCGEGEGGPFVADGHIAPDGSHPITTDGGTMSFSHAGANPQMMQRDVYKRQPVARPRRLRADNGAGDRNGMDDGTFRRATGDPPGRVRPDGRSARGIRRHRRVGDP